LCPCVEMMEKSPALKATDYNELAQCLDDALAIFERHMGALNFMELRTKSILSAIRAEIDERNRTTPPFKG
jgi:hypothetical protein